MTDHELFQQALDDLLHVSDGLECLETIAALQDRLAQPEPEPLGWIVMHEGMNIDELRINEVEQMGYDEKPMPNQYRVYTAPPPQREWQGLTEEEIEIVRGHFPAYSNEWCDSDYVDFARAIEAKLREKNT